VSDINGKMDTAISATVSDLQLNSQVYDDVTSSIRQKRMSEALG